MGYSNPNEALQDHVDEEDKLNSKTLSSFSLDLGQRGGWLINESGLYSLVLSSKLPTARAFNQ
ncbi:MAG TPA: Bro-N domain-containing protein [Candidatus Gallacutalibacter stercoravium]|nr:Bro-N domain-containing protein [Candidatus Gallacutalibacter stercoravium]